jgi:hypothetical protein
MNTPALDTALYLSTLSGFGGFGGSADWSIFVGREPLTPVDVVTVYDTGGQAPTLKGGPQLRYPTIQARVRSSDYNAGWNRADLVMRALFEVTSETTNGGVNVAWNATTDILYIGRDDKDRALFTVNFQMIRDPS